MGTQKVIQVAPNRWHERGMPTPQVLVVAGGCFEQTNVKNILESSGYEVTTIDGKTSERDGLFGINYAAAIVDLDSPQVNGLTLMQRFRYLFQNSYVPIIAMTTNKEFSAKCAAAEAGADAFLNKPVSAEELLGTITQLFNLVALTQLYYPSLLASESREIDYGALANLNGGDRHALVHMFETEMHRFMNELILAIETNCLSKFLSAMTAIKELARKVGAMRLVAACEMTEELELAQTTRNGEQVIKNIRLEFDQALVFLKKLFEVSNVKSG